MPTKSPQRSCRSKKKYSEEKTAQVSATRCNKNGIYVKAYKCPVCSGWHLARRGKVSVLEELFKRIDLERSFK